MGAFFALMLAIELGAGGVAMEQLPLDEQLRQVMADCGRPGYVLKAVGDRRLIVTALPNIRQTPISKAERRCIGRGVRKLGFTLSEDGR